MKNSYGTKHFLRPVDRQTARAMSGEGKDWEVKTRIVDVSKTSIIHTAILDTVCPICSVAMTKKNLNKHLQRVHLEIPARVCCFLCKPKNPTSATFSIPANTLDDHIRKAHRLDSPDNAISIYYQKTERRKQGIQNQINAYKKKQEKEILRESLLKIDTDSLTKPAFIDQQVTNNKVTAYIENKGRKIKITKIKRD